MSFFNQIKKRKIQSRIEDEDIYKQVVNEISNGVMKEGIWGKALSESNGDNEGAKSIYIKYRAQSLKNAKEISKYLNEENLKIESNKINKKKKSLFTRPILLIIFIAYILFIITMVSSAIGSKM